MTSLLPPAAGEHRDLDGYWAGLSAGELRAPKCRACLLFNWPPRAACPHCGAVTPAWERLPAIGRVYTWTVVHHTTLEAFKAMTPYVVALIDIPEAGIRLIGHVREAPAAINFGTPLNWRVDQTGAQVPGVFWIPCPEGRRGD